MEGAIQSSIGSELGFSRTAPTRLVCSDANAGLLGCPDSVQEHSFCSHTVRSSQVVRSSALASSVLLSSRDVIFMLVAVTSTDTTRSRSFSEQTGEHDWMHVMVLAIKSVRKRPELGTLRAKRHSVGYGPTQ